MTPPIITFTSDFGLDDWFVGVVHGVLHERCPGARVVDLTHSIPPGNVARAAFVLEAATPDFPAGTVHLVVVDPGVGTDRRALAVRSRGFWYVAPDNGVLEWALADADARSWSLEEPALFRSPVSRTFHGRDVFAPVAAALACGHDPARLGPSVTNPVRLPPVEVNNRRDSSAREGDLPGWIMYIDRFGNALTSLDEGSIARAFPGVAHSDLEVHAGGRAIFGLARSYGDAKVGTVIAIIGSSGRVEIAQVGGAADSRLGLGIGDPVRLRRRGSE